VTKLQRPDKNGVTTEQHLRQLARAKRLDPIAFVRSHYKVPKPPHQLLFVWRAFWDLSNCRRVGMQGPEAINFQDIAAWCSLYDVKLRTWEIDLIQRLDRTWLKGIRDGNRS
jgi:hypothetical protein